MKYLLFLLAFMMTAAVYGQQVSGKVTDPTGQAIPGATVLVKGTTNGTVTDLNGHYSLSKTSPQSVLVFSFVGMESKEVAVANQTIINAVLTEETTGLKEVVVVGYGIQKKSDVTGAVASVKEEGFNKLTSSTPTNMIQGKISGVQIISNSGEPGAGSRITIRGTSSIRTGTQPLYVIDGIPLDMGNTSAGGGNSYTSTPTDPLTFINANDIASIDILKDASAAAIYGSRGANGVVLITTKKGKEGNNEVTYSSTVSIGSIRKQLSVLAADQWRVQRNAVKGFSSSNPDPNDYGASTDWQDQVFRTAYSHDHSLSFIGGSDKTQYRASFNYNNTQGIMQKSDMKKYVGSLNLTQKALNNKILFNSSLTASEIIQNRLPLGTQGYEGDALVNALQANPTWPVYDSKGNPFQSSSASLRSPVALINYTNDLTRETRILGSTSATVLFSSHFNYKINIGMDYMNSNRMIDQSQKLNIDGVYGIGSGQRNNREMYNYLIENTLNYDNTFNHHHISALAGYSYQNFQIRDAYTTGKGYITDALLYTNNIGSGTSSMTNISSDADSYKLQSFFGRVNYSFMEKYLLTATVRADGSSKFGTNKQYGVFPSFAAGWRLGEEDFIKKLDFFENLKLRFGWGKTGNSEIGTHNSQTLYSPTSNASAVVGGSTIMGLVISKTPNPDITWETTQSTDAGLEFTILKGRLSGDADYYYKTTSNLLLSVPSQAVSPTSTVVKNIPGCKIVNKGVELGLTGKAIVAKNFSWDISANATFQSNKVKNLPVAMYQTGAAVGQGLSNAYCQIITSNQPINVFYGKKITSIDSKGVVHYLQTSSGTDSLTYLGNPSPNFIWSITNSFKYKNWDLTIFINGVSGNKIFNNTAVLLDKTNINIAHNTLTRFAYDNVDIASYTPTVSSRYVENGAYARLSNVTLGYTFNLKNKLWVKRLRAYVTASNLCVITKYSGYDPDVTASREFSGNGVNSFGIDNGNYPRPRTFLLGISATF